MTAARQKCIDQFGTLVRFRKKILRDD